MKKIFLIVAGIVGLVVIAGATLLYINRDKIASYAMDRALTTVEGQVLQHMPDQTTVVAVKKDFATLHDRLQAGSVKVEEIKEFAAMFYNSYKDERLDSLEVRQLIDKIHKLVEQH